jgi:formylglycine-generating enzyme required for sulfatase activity/predicted Ser/Thr protein kinase
MLLPPGTILHNRYRIVKPLGQGGFGAMYRAWDTTLDRICAIKENLDASPEARRQFMHEAKILAKLTHPNLPRVTDYFFIQIQGQYLVMDFVEGRDLQEILDDEGDSLPEDKALAWIEQVCDALAYLHSQQPAIIHRDIKPANIKITPSGQAMLVDFGIAKIYDPNLKTTAGAQAVTPGFSPVEQYGKGVTDARSDIYALGATLYTLLTAEEPPESVGRVIRDPLRPPRMINRVISQRTESAIMRALQTDPDQRFQNATDFKAALRPPIKVHQPQPVATSPSDSSSIPWKWVGLLSLISLLVVVVVSMTLLSGAIGGPSYSGQFPIAEVSSPSQDSSTPAKTETVILTVTDMPAPSPTPLVYVVQPGDTCSQIALTFGVSQSSIVALNDLSADCGVLYAGQELFIPAISLPSIDSSPASFSSTLPLPVKTRIANLDGMPMVYVPPGNFLMGAADSDPEAGADEKPQHLVYLDAFWIDLTEVTNNMYAKCVKAGACSPPDKESSKTRLGYYGDEHYADYPVIYVSWQDAQDYCSWAGRRLPTEAEWEKAARGTDGWIYPWGNERPNSRYLNFNNQVGDTTPAGFYPPGASPYGAFDMAGNVAEWVADWYSEDAYASSEVRNPSGPETGEYRVLRGGSWFNPPRAVRTTFRLWNLAGLGFETGGFRCARSE